MKITIWILWGIITIAVGGFYAYTIFLNEDKESLLIGEASHGHFQIELDCGQCHTDAFGGQDVLQDACVGCHGAELELAQDSHPRKKFSDPRNAERLIGIDARYCISCHSEHKEEQTNLMGLTMPNDYCLHCHEDIAKERASHQDLGFETCANAGCHNYHDNRALYETFLANNAHQPWILENPHLTIPNNAALNAAPHLPHHELAFPNQRSAHPQIMDEWAESSHSEAGVNCGGCHSDASGSWVESPSYDVCASCHSSETETFLLGKHGMRLAADLAPMDTNKSRLDIQKGATAHNGCNNCHKPHKFDREFAAVEACLTCHIDEHSLAFKSSPHSQIQQALGGLDTSAKRTSSPIVTCASCHMPSIQKVNGVKNSISGTVLADNKLSNTHQEDLVMHVDHNQNNNLRPNEKMIRPVCMQCHSLEFSINSLADPALIKNNFNGQPSVNVPSINWALKNQGIEN